MEQEISLSQKTTFPASYNRFLVINMYVMIQLIYSHMFIISVRYSAC